MNGTARYVAHVSRITLGEYPTEQMELGAGRLMKRQHREKDMNRYEAETSNIGVGGNDV